jgi:purine-binding chemotaxis protein CheW
MTRGFGIDWQAVRQRLAESEKAVERSLSPDAARMRAVMRQRAARLAARRRDGEVEARLDVLGFWLGEEHCALEVTAVAEVLPFRRCTSVPGMPDELLGVVNLRSQIRPVIDLPRLIAAKRLADAEGGYILFLRDEPNEIGVRVDRVEAVRGIAVGQLARPGDADGGLSSRFARGMGPDGLVLLDAQAVKDALRGILTPAA